MFINAIGIIALVISCGIAYRWGGRDERLASFAFVLATLASRFSVKANYANTETALLTIDVLLLAALILLSLRSDRFWPMWTAAFQMLAVGIHFASLTELGSYAWPYAVALIFWSYMVLVAHGAGTWLEVRQRRDTLSA